MHRAIRVCIKMLAVLMVLVIVLDINETPVESVFAIGAVTQALGVTYWLTSASGPTPISGPINQEAVAESPKSVD